VELDPQHTFDTFVVGPANRLASAASRRAADSPGRSFNPLFIYSSSGLGKSHLLAAISYQAEVSHSEVRVLYKPIEQYLDDLEHALERGERDVLKNAYRDLDILLVDDVQFITGHQEAQEMLLGTLDALTAEGSQVVLASDRPPQEIDDLDARLLSRFSGGLIVDIAMPEFETRVAIIRRKIDSRGSALEDGVAGVIARYPYENVRELQGALNRILAVQEVEERLVDAKEVGALLGPDGASGKGGEFASFVDELSATVASTMVEEEAGWVKGLRQAMSRAEADGFNASRLERLLEAAKGPDEASRAVKIFEDELDRLKEVRAELDRIGNPWPEAAVELLSNPDRLREAEALLASARERHRPFPPLPDGPTLATSEGRFSPLALNVANQLIDAERPEYNPLYVWSKDATDGRALMLATGRSALEGGVHERVARISVEAFAEEFIESLSAGVAGAWRERWWTTQLLLLEGIESLASTERAQEELFHLFEALKRSGARILLSADRPPSKVEGISDRLRSRFEGGLVLEVEPGDGSGVGADFALPVLEPVTKPAPAPEPAKAKAQPAMTEGGDWFPSPESVLWEWPRVQDRIAEDLG